MFTDKKILIVDDERGLLDLLRLTLHKEGFTNVTCADTATEALRLVRESEFDLLLLDVMLPDFSGFDLCQEIRKFSYVPIIFITALDTDFNQFTGLAIGGDDYITKPLKPLLIVSKVRAMLRRQEYGSAQPGRAHNKDARVYQNAKFSLNLSDGTLAINDEAVAVTAKELELLHYFCENPNRVFTATQLYEAVWGSDSLGDDKTVIMHISTLRKKLGDNAKQPEIIVNQRGIGYKFIPPTSEAAL